VMIFRLVLTRLICVECDVKPYYTIPCHYPSYPSCHSTHLIPTIYQQMLSNTNDKMGNVEVVIDFMKLV